MNTQHPWDGRDLLNPPPKTIQRVVVDPKARKDICKKQSIMESVSVSDCLSTKLFKEEKHQSLTVKVPVVLAEPKIEINLESFVKLEEPAIEIKRIRKNVELTQCDVLPSFSHCKKPTIKLFLAGFVRKNIEYATADYGNPQKINGNIRHTTVKVPFNCITEVELAKEITPSIEFQNPNPKAELEFLDPNKKLSRDQREFGNINAEFLNEKIFCELVKSSVIELDIILDERPLKKGCQTEKVFRTLKEKMVILISLKVLQNQQVSMLKEKKEKDMDKDKKKDKCKHKHKHKHKVKVKVKVEDKDKEKDKKKRKKKEKDKKKDRDRKKDKRKDKDRDRDREIDKERDDDKDKPKKKFNLKEIIDKAVKETE